MKPLIEEYKGYKIYDNSQTYVGFDISVHQKDDRWMVDFTNIEQARELIDKIT
jgi:hypothetical protein